MLSFYNRKMIETGKRYGYKTASFDLQAGHTCPMASLCHSRVIVEKGKRHVKDYGSFRCYAVKAEVQYPRVHKARVQNYKRSLKDTFIKAIVKEIKAHKVNLVRIHSAGDFYNFTYFQKWIEVIKSLPDVQFFAYTKQATFMRWYLENQLPNFKMTYSMGGLQDDYAKKHNLSHCTVIINGFNPENLPISCTEENHVDDFEYIMRGESFGINFH